MDETAIGSGCTYMPDCPDEKVDSLFDLVARKRFTTFVTVVAEIQQLAPKLCATSGFSESAFGVMASPAPYRRALVGDPAFLVWLNLAMAAVNRLLTGAETSRGPLRRSLEEFGAMRQRFEERRQAAADRVVPGTDILVQRFDIDPLVARVTPPSYTFSTAAAKRRRLAEAGYSKQFFRDVARVALQRIADTWPECFQQLTRLVRVIGYLPDATFRSCSASRYTGTIYLAAKDNSILDVEESLVHEAGHQLLYTIVEAWPVTRDEDDGRQYRLPWSGQSRDFYGYFHAFFIYVLLAKYFERVVSGTTSGHSAEDRERARERLLYILRGLREAVADFAENGSFTAAGRELSRSLREDIARLSRDHDQWLRTTPALALAGTVRAVE